MRTRLNSGPSDIENISIDNRIFEQSDKLMMIKEQGNPKIDPLSSSLNPSYLNTKLNINKNEKRIRATSESSTESNLSSSLNSNFLNIKNYKIFRPALFNNLKKLTSEKMILTSNNIPLCVFSRIAYRSNTCK